jgi:hypothetical protein
MENGRMFYPKFRTNFVGRNGMEEQVLVPVPRARAAEERDNQEKKVCSKQGGME